MAGSAEPRRSGATDLSAGIGGHGHGGAGTGCADPGSSRRLVAAAGGGGAVGSPLRELPDRRHGDGRTRGPEPFRQSPPVDGLLRPDPLRALLRPAQSAECRHQDRQCPYTPRVLVESAWSYARRARETRQLRCKGADAPPEVQAIACKAQRRLCGRYRRLSAAGKPGCKVATAVALEFSGFVWAIVCQAMKIPETDPGKRAAA